MRLALVALLAAALLGSTSGHCDSARPPAADRPNPSFSLIDASGAQVSLSGFAGRKVVVHFFATWCEPCRAELPALDRLLARTGAGDVAVLAISVAEVPVRVRRFLEQTPVGFPILLDQDRAIAKAWGVTTLPTSFVLDAALKTRVTFEQEHDWDRFDPVTLEDQHAREGRP